MGGMCGAEHGGGRAVCLQDIDGQDWGEPDPEDSYLIRTCTALHRRPLAEFDDEALRIMIGQGIGLPTLIPMATEILQQRPLASGDMHPERCLRPSWLHPLSFGPRTMNIGHRWLLLRRPWMPQTLSSLGRTSPAC